MHCCSNCFTSSYLKGLITANDRKGVCDFCKTPDTSIYLASEFADQFRNILSLYAPSQDSKYTLIEAIEKDFKLFTQKVQSPENLLNAIFSSEPKYLESFIATKASFKNRALLEDETNNLHNLWKDFKDEIKYTNRYHIQNVINFKKIETFFMHDSFCRNIKKEETFYRCRISKKNGFPSDKMGCPPNPELASAGRANPKGIPYLYIANSLETSIYETRASLYDYVTVGKFRPSENIKVLNLRNPQDEPIFWSENEEIKNYLIYIPFIKTLQKELSLPIKKDDKALDYIPTQYISEFIKSLGFDGVEYQSSLNDDGYNIAIFNPDKFECFETDTYEIEKINFEYNKT